MLSSLKRLKELASDYMHPEKPVVTSYPCPAGRNYFCPVSVREYEDEDDTDEHRDLIDGMMQLKQLAQDYRQPECAVVVDPIASHMSQS